MRSPYSSGGTVIQVSNKRDSEGNMNKKSLIRKITAGVFCLALSLTAVCPLTAFAAETEQKTVRVGFYPCPFNIVCTSDGFVGKECGGEDPPCGRRTLQVDKGRPNFRLTNVNFFAYAVVLSNQAAEKRADWSGMEKQSTFCSKN